VVTAKYRQIVSKPVNPLLFITREITLQGSVKKTVGRRRMIAAKIL